MKERFEIQPDYELQKGCCCLSCREPTGKWRFIDIDDVYEDIIFDTKEEAEFHLQRMSALDKAQQAILKINEENKKLRQDLGLDEKEDVDF